MKTPIFRSLILQSIKNQDNAFIVVANWMRNHSTISFLGLWEQIHNPILNLSNSIGLKQSQEIMHLH